MDSHFFFLLTQNYPCRLRYAMSVVKMKYELYQLDTC